MQPPYGGAYEIKRPDLGMVGIGTTFEMLEDKVRAYRRAMGMPTGLGFSEELEQKICELYPQEAEVCDPNLPRAMKLSYGDITAGTKVLWSFKKAGSPLVPQAEAVRRGAICSNCKLCVPFTKPCNGLCGELKDYVDYLTSGYTTPYDNDLRGCSICHCFYSGHIRIPYEHLNKGLNDEERSQFQAANQLWGCWKVPGAV